MAIILIVAGLIGAAFIGIGRGKEQGFTEMNRPDMHNALAVIAAGSVIAKAIASRDAGAWSGVALVLAGLSFIVTGLILTGSMLQLDRAYWRQEPFLTFATLFAGGLTALAIASFPKPAGGASRDSEDEGEGGSP